jgi:hypothetical protein
LPWSMCAMMLKFRINSGEVNVVRWAWETWVTRVFLGRP